MARAPMKLHVKKNQLHKDVGKAPGAKITEADIAKEKSKGGVYAKRAQFAENAKKWNHPGKGSSGSQINRLGYGVGGFALKWCAQIVALVPISMPLWRRML